MNRWLLALFLPLLGCGPPTVHRPDGPAWTGDSETTDDSDATDDSEATDDTDAAPGPCRAGMVLVDDRVCIDRFESALEERLEGAWTPASPYDTVDGRTVRATVDAGVVPQAYISADEAAQACDAADKRLCTTDEWLAACQGPDDWTFPYGPAHQEGACNDRYEGGHPVVDYFGTSEGVWDPAHMNDPGINQQPNTVARTGAFERCRSAWGVHDLHGNLHEWVADTDGTFRGGFYADAAINGPGCTYRTVAHGRRYHDYSTGFRCCRDPE